MQVTGSFPLGATGMLSPDGLPSIRESSYSSHNRTCLPVSHWVADGSKFVLTGTSESYSSPSRASFHHVQAEAEKGWLSSTSPQSQRESERETHGLGVR
jgi:hypothetical protein